MGPTIIGGVGAGVTGIIIGDVGIGRMAIGVGDGAGDTGLGDGGDVGPDGNRLGAG